MVVMRSDATNQLKEITRPTFPWRKRGLVSYGLPFLELVVTHVQRLGKQRVFALVSGSLEENTNCLWRLEQVLGPKLVGSRVGFPGHTLWDQVLALAKQIDESGADLVVTLGGGSITDGVKLATFPLANNIYDLQSLDVMSAKLKAAMQHDIDYKYSKDPPGVNAPTFTMINVPTTLSAGEFSPYAGGIRRYSG
ncbi:hypothetical protein B7463_g6112, partial [Scytalidium lignicola]